MKNFIEMQTNLNQEIINEVKTALSTIDGKCFKWDGKTPLCRIIASPQGDYNPVNLAVTKIWLDEENTLRFNAIDVNCGEKFEWSEEDELHDIVDFQYLIEQIEEKKSAKNNKSVRITFLSQILFTGSLEDIAMQWNNIDLFSDEANKCYACELQVCSVEDMDNGDKDIKEEFEKII